MTSRRLELYLTELSIENDENAFQLPWGGMLLQNCGKYGNLIKFENKKQKKRKGKQLWVYLPLQIFREDGEVFGIFRCTTCEQIKHFISLKVDQKMDDLLEQMCIHSRAANYFRGSDWEQFWPCGLHPSDETYNIQCNIETDFVRFEQIVSSCSPA